MRNIHKNAEPCSLTEHRKTPFTDYDNYKDKNTLRQSLIDEQRGLCCYCQARIRPSVESMKIEHWRCQDVYPELQLDYRNMLGACLGGHGQPEDVQHCDTLKGDSDLCFSPADPACNVEHKIQFLGDGRIQSYDPSFDNDMNKVLNLNLKQFISNRKAVLTAFQQRLQAGKKLEPLKELTKWDGSQTGDLPEYAQVIVYWLRKRQARIAK